MERERMASETSPLLRPEQRHANVHTNGRTSQHDKPTWFRRSILRPAQSVADHVGRHKVLYYIALFSLIIDISFMMMIAPMARLSELGLCRKHYLKVDPSLVDENGDVPELLCKIKPVQEALANLSGLLTVVGLIPTILFSVPFGSLADRFGRKIVCALGIIGLSLGFFWYFLVLQYYKIFPFFLVYTFPIFFVIGGGGNVILALISAMIVDVTSTASRARVFLLLSTTMMFAGLIGPPIGSALLANLGPGPAFLWTLPPRLLSILLLFLIPETKNLKNKSTSGPHSDSTVSEGEPGSLTMPLPITTRMRVFVQHLKRDVLPIMRQKAIVLGMFSLVVNHFTLPVVGMIVQYISLRFLWKFEKASFIIAFASGAQIILNTTVIPAIDHYLKRKYKSPEMASLVLSRGSIFFLVLGMIIIGSAPNAVAVFVGLFMYTCGAGYGPALRAYMTSLVPPKDIALLFTIVGVFDSFGSLFGAPLLAFTFATGIEYGGMAIGLPFYFAAVIYALSGVSIWSLVPPEKELEEDDQAGPDEVHDGQRDHDI